MISPIHFPSKSAWALAIGLFCSVLVAVTLSIIFSLVLAKITCCDAADGAVPLLSTVSDVLGILMVVGIADHLMKGNHSQ